MSGRLQLRADKIWYMLVAKYIYIYTYVVMGEGCVGVITNHITNLQSLGIYPVCMLEGSRPKFTELNWITPILCSALHQALYRNINEISLISYSRAYSVARKQISYILDRHNIRWHRIALKLDTCVYGYKWYRISKEGGRIREAWDRFGL